MITAAVDSRQEKNKSYRSLPERISVLLRKVIAAAPEVQATIKKDPEVWAIIKQGLQMFELTVGKPCK